MLVHAGLLFISVAFTIQAQNFKDNSQSEFFKLNHQRLIELSRKNRQMGNVKPLLGMGGVRTKRSTGVKVCPKETIRQVVASHQEYYRLRVCQAAVWESFRILLDRIPDVGEYDRWVSLCQLESWCMTDLLQNFSSSQEHMDMVRKRVNDQAPMGPEGPELLESETTEDIVLKGVPATKPCHNSSEDVRLEAGSALPHTLPEEPVEHVVEFSVTLKHRLYNGTDLPQLHNTTHGLHDEILQVMEKLPAFKEMRRTGPRSGGFSVRYAVVFEAHASGSLEGDTNELEAKVGHANGSLIKSSLNDMVAKALSKDKFLPEDLYSLHFGPENVVDPVLSATARAAEHATSSQKGTSLVEQQGAAVDYQETLQESKINRGEHFNIGSTAISPGVPTDLPVRELTFTTQSPAASTPLLQSIELPEEDSSSPGIKTLPLLTASDRTEELVVFFSLRVTDMVFSEDLFNKSSPEYKLLQNLFLELTQVSNSKDWSSPKSQSWRPKTLASIPLLPYLQSNSTGLKEFEILNFMNGRMIVNSKMIYIKPTEPNVSEPVPCAPEDLCKAASRQLDIEIDSLSLDAEADPCRSWECSEFSRCVINRVTQETECLCDPGYSAVEGLPCQSICSLQPDYCLNGGQCEIVPGQGAACRCPVGKYWHFHGERCAELVSVPVDPVLFVISLVGCLLIVSVVIGVLTLINRKCIRTRKSMSLVRSQSPFLFERTMRVNPVFEGEESTLTRVSTLHRTDSDVGSSGTSQQGTLGSLENIQISIEIPRQLYNTRPDKLVSEMVDFHYCIPHNMTWQLPYRLSGTTCCSLKPLEAECPEVTCL